MKIAAAIALLAATPLLAQAPAKPLTMEQQTSLRCSAAFAIVAARQNAGAVRTYPELTQRGREFFVRSGARLMDDAGLTRAQVQALMEAEARTLAADNQALQDVMPACLLLLDASGL